MLYKNLQFQRGNQQTAEALIEMCYNIKSKNFFVSL